MLDRPLAFLDLETTGATASFDRITEVGLIEVGPRGRVAEWSTLVNPEIPIPPFIESLTGISNDMVAAAPTFRAIAPELQARLAGRLLIAHNARFDYGFLKNEFGRLDIKYASDVVCTVKLSRKLFPGHARHNLDSLMERHGVSCNARHRALGDARVLWDLIRKWRDELGTAAIDAAARAQFTAPALPPGLSALALEEVPESPGVYLFYGENHLPLYVGRGVNLRARVLAHFTGDLRTAKNARIAQQVKRVDWKETAGELGALLEEARLVKELLPAMNRPSRQVALREPQLAAWPFNGRIGVREASGDRTDLHVLDRWCYLGTVRSEQDLDTLAARPSFDLGTYKILKRFLQRRPLRFSLIELAA